MTLIDNHYKKVPEYYDWMYLDGFTPDEIMYALHKKMDREYLERMEEQNAIDSIHVKSEVKIKR